MIKKGHKRLKVAATRLTVQPIDGKVTIGNSRGPSFKEQATENQRDIAKLESEMDKQQEEITGLVNEVAALRAEISHHSSNSTGYYGIRNRFISTYKRDKLNMETPEDHETIAQGNRTVHEGDCQADHYLYDDTPDGRKDVNVFISLYGLPPRAFRPHYICPVACFVLNKHVSLVASASTRARPEFFEPAFKDFITALEVSVFDDDVQGHDDPQDPKHSLTESYGNFWRAVGRRG